MRKFIRQFLEDIQHGENIDLVVTIALVLVISVINALNLASPELVSSITLATLGLIAVGLLVTRYKIDNIHRASDSVNLVHLNMQKPATLAKDLANEKEIWMLGLTLRGTTTVNFYQFRNRTSQRLKIRTIIVDSSQLEQFMMERIVSQFSRGGIAEQFRADFMQTVTQYKEIRKMANSSDQIQLKVIDFVPPFSLYIFPKAEDDGVIYVEIYGYKSPLGSVPKFRLTKRENPEWYRYFIGQFETIWQNAKAITL